MSRRGLALFAVLILVVLGTVVAAATLMTAESSTLASRSTRDAVDRMLRVRSALAIAAHEMAPKRAEVLGGGGVRVARRPLEALGDTRWRVVWSDGDAGSRRGGPVELAAATETLVAVASLRSGGGASAWEPEVRAVGGGEPRVPVAEFVAGGASGFASALQGAESRSGVVDAMRGAGADAVAIEAVLDAVRFGDAAIVAGRVDINRAAAEEIAAAGVAMDDAEAIVRARDRRSPGERASVYWPIASASIDDFDECVAALDGLTTRTLQWVVRGAVVAYSDDAAWPVVGFRGVVDLSGAEPRWVCVGLDVGVTPGDEAVAVDSEFEALPTDGAISDGDGGVGDGRDDDDAAGGSDEGTGDDADVEAGAQPMNRWSGGEP